MESTATRESRRSSRKSHSYGLPFYHASLQGSSSLTKSSILLSLEKSRTIAIMIYPLPTAVLHLPV